MKNTRRVALSGSIDVSFIIKTEKTSDDIGRLYDSLQDLAQNWNGSIGQQKVRGDFIMIPLVFDKFNEDLSHAVKVIKGVSDRHGGKLVNVKKQISRRIAMDDSKVERIAKSLVGSDSSDAIAKAIDLLNYLPNAASEWYRAHGGNKDLAEKNGKKIKSICDQLGEVLASMPASMKYQVYGALDGKVFNNAVDLIKALRSIGISYSGPSDSGSFRPELRGQPTFKELVGPMYDGGGKIRYETEEVYEMMSR